MLGPILFPSYMLPLGNIIRGVRRSREIKLDDISHHVKNLSRCGGSNAPFLRLAFQKLKKEKKKKRSKQPE